MYIYMYVYIQVCMYVCSYVCSYVCMYVYKLKMFLFLSLSFTPINVAIVLLRQVREL